MTFYAHTALDAMGQRLPEQHWQLLVEHLDKVAKKAGEFAEPLGLAGEARVAGMLHDLGKYQDGFQSYLKCGKPKTPHAIFGAAAVLTRNARLANAVASHHAGLHDWPELLPKLTKLFRESKGTLGTCLKRLSQESPLPPPSVPAPAESAEVARELLTRLLFSALVDADYLDTEAHFLASAGEPLPQSSTTKIAELCQQLENHVGRLASAAAPSALDSLRRRVNDRCAEAGKRSTPGVFSLAVPTGGGKTLASARFALCHAKQHGFQRIIYVIPYTSIIEQNAQVFSAIFGEGAVLEHHGLARWQETDDEEPETIAQQKKRAAENWDAPFIITTNVQFFESLFSHRPADCRKLHRLLNAVIIFDECQTFPPELLRPTLERLKALVALDRTTLVLCTATQPAFRRHTGFAEGFNEVAEIIPPEWELHRLPEFTRTVLSTRREAVSCDAFCQELCKVSRALVIVNTRQQAWEIFQRVRGDGVYHLSTTMCPAHRLVVLEAVKLRLGSPDVRCVVISTQLVEAGVDFDFPIVYRAQGPLDSIIQAAGRCNREGRLRDESGASKDGKVIVFRLEENRLPSGTYRRATELAASTDFLPDRLEGNFSPGVIRRYFESLYGISERDKHNIAQLCHDECYRQIGEKYRWIESDTVAVLTDYSEVGAAWQATFATKQFVPPTRQQWRAIARYCVNLPKPDVENLLRTTPKLRQLRNGLVMTQAGSYDAEYGFNFFGDTPVDLLIL